MHPEARAYVARTIGGQHFGDVIDVGGRDVNGSIKDLAMSDHWTSIDLEPGAGVDIVADCREWNPPAPVDLVVCCEVLEHAPDAVGVIDACVRYLRPGGRLVLTCAGPGRAPHSGHDGWDVRAGEHYANIDPVWLQGVLAERGLQQIRVETHPGHHDVYATATR